MFDLVNRLALGLGLMIVVSQYAAADPVTFSFTGQLDNVFDGTIGSVLGGQFDVGDPFTGTLTYDDSAVDLDPREGYGAYYYYAPPSALVVTINGFVFSNDFGAGGGQLFVLVGNDETNEVGDTFDSLSVTAGDAVSFPFPTGSGITNLGISLRDLTATAIDSESLPSDLDASAWPDEASLSLTSELGPTAENFWSLSGTILDFELQTGIEVEIDIKPGSDPNCFNIDGNGVVPVAILGSDELDVAMINQSTLSFGGLGVRVRGNKGPQCGLSDTNQDGVYDLVCHFEDDADNWSVGDGQATLSGELWDGTEIEGSDQICVVP